MIPKKNLPLDFTVGILGCSKGKGDTISYRISNSSKRLLAIRFGFPGTPFNLVPCYSGLRLKLPESPGFLTGLLQKTPFSTRHPARVLMQAQRESVRPALQSSWLFSTWCPPYYWVVRKLPKPVPLLKSKSPPRGVLRPRRRLNAWCAVDCAAGGLRAIHTPLPLLTSPGGLVSPHWARGLKSLGHLPGCGGQAFKPLGRLQLQNCTTLS